MKKILFILGIGVILSSCKKEDSQEQKNVTFQEVNKELLQLAKDQKSYVLTKEKDLIRKIEDVDNFVSPALKENLGDSYSQARPYLEKVLLEGKERTYSFEKLDTDIERIEVSEYTRNIFKQVVSLYKNTSFRGDYSLIEELEKEDLNNLSINEKKMLYDLYTICDIIRDSNIAGTSFFKARCTIDGLDMLEAFVYGCIGGGPQVGVACAFANLAFQAIRKC